MGGGMGGGGMGGDIYGGGAQAAPSPTSSVPGKQAPKQKMSLKSKSNKNSLMEKMALEGEVMEDPVATMGMEVTAAPKNMVMREAVHILIEEVGKLSFEADGTMQSMQINGNVNLLVTDPASAPIKIHVAHSGDTAFQFKTHPKLQKDAFFGSSDPWLRLAKDPAFPCDNPLGILKWRYTNSDEDKAPLKVTCWPSDQRGKTHCNLEYELGSVIEQLEDIIIQIPVPSQPEVLDSTGETQYDHRNGNLYWKLDSVDGSNSSGSLEFSLPAVDHGSFFPIDVKFTAPQTFCDIQLLEVLNVSTDAPVKYSKQTTLKIEEYTIDNGE